MPKNPTSPLVECVVNVSEGRNVGVIEAFAQAIRGVPGCYLLHQDVGADAHRTVLTFAGPPAAVLRAAETVYAVADERLDLRGHRGEHPRSGAVDVCPFVPIAGVDVEALKEAVRAFAARIAERYDLPVYLYADSATAPHRANLAALRRGEFERLAERLASARWRPDFGPQAPHPRLGATVIGVRPFLIAWNINLSEEATLPEAQELAARLRGSGGGGRAGLFPGLKAIGWCLAEYHRCQISCNVVDPERTDLARVYLTAASLAEERGVRVTGSELIGLIPARYLRAAAKQFCWSEDEGERMETAVLVLGLDELGPFDWRERVLEEVYRSVVG